MHQGIRLLQPSLIGDRASGLRLWRPKTMTSLVAIGCLLAATPLLLALMMSGVMLERLSRHSEALVRDGVTLSQLGSQLRDNVQNLERNAHQYIALGDTALLDVFFRRVLEAETTLRQLEREGFHAALAGHITRVREGLTEVSQNWTRSLKNGESLDRAVARIQSLRPEADAIVAAGRAEIAAQVDKLREASRLAREVMLWSSLALIPLTALLAFGFSVAVTRPLQRLSAGISALGHANYRQAIAIAYPQEMQHLGEQLDWLRRRLAQLEEDKDRFLRHVSHELKTPLASLREGADLLCEGSVGKLTPRQAEVARILAESAGELGQQIHNLLTYAEWREERHQAPKGWFDAQPLVEEVLAAHKLPLAKRGLKAELDLRVPRLFGQRTRLRVALDNLIGNAVKHAPQGTAIQIHAAAVDGACVLAVRDFGRGVPDRDKQRIFDPFVRGTEAEEASVRGTGVGLSIVREIALAHGGKVEVEDANPGARFKLEWPCPGPVS